MKNQLWKLQSRPQGKFNPECCVFVEEDLQPLQENEYRVQNSMLSCDPTQLGWMQFDTYFPKIELDSVVRSLGIGEVIESKNPNFKMGDRVAGLVGWQKYTTFGKSSLFPASKVPSTVDDCSALSVLGITGLTAYYGMGLLGQPQENEVVVVSGAAGATGSVACQIARIKGAIVIGIAGSEQKCQWLTETAKIQHVINYKQGNVGQQIKQLAPHGVNLYFDNVGGEILDAVLSNLALRARILICGGIAEYEKEKPRGLFNIMNLVIKRATMQGFLFSDLGDRVPEALDQLGRWVAEGKIKSEVDVQMGLANTPQIFSRLFTGQNLGKQLIQLNHL